MSRLLRSKKKTAACCLLLLAAVSLCVGMWYVSLLLVAGLAVLSLNRIVRRKNMRAYREALSPKREIRQWNTIVAGELPPRSENLTKAHWL